MAQILKVDYRNARVVVQASYAREGSVIAGDARTTCEGFTTALEMDSDAPLDRVAHMIRMAEQTCFTMAALRNAVPCELKAMVNGETLALG